MDWIRENKVKSVLILLLFVFLTWFLLRERHAELLKIKEECKELAEAKVAYYNDSEIGTHQLMGHGYSEYGGYCYAEILQNYEHESQLLYNTTQDKEVVRRAWPDDISWYNYEFD